MPESPEGPYDGPADGSSTSITPLVPDACRSATGMYVPGVERQLERSIRVNYAHDARDARVPTCTARDS